ncbi:MAG: hypothetical protein KatS3mg111_2217 [Pirellulaceae bacterium]|nr:MAG: hypothetical protein KatS3mg111_2217 [Pirellulaceae bacterium]
MGDAMIALTDEPIDLTSVLSAVEDPSCGGQVLFVGTTRQWTTVEGRSVETDHLQYEAYRPLALAELQRLAEEARTRWPVRKICLIHRLGRVKPTEASVAVAVATPHRAEAFEAAKWLIDEIKHRVAIWKQEHYVQRGSEWIHPTSGSCRCDHSTKQI